MIILLPLFQSSTSDFVAVDPATFRGHPSRSRGHDARRGGIRIIIPSPGQRIAVATDRPGGGCRCGQNIAERVSQSRNSVVYGLETRTFVRSGPCESRGWPMEPSICDRMGRTRTNERTKHNGDATIGRSDRSHSARTRHTRTAPVRMSAAGFSQGILATALLSSW